MRSLRSLVLLGGLLLGVQVANAGGGNEPSVPYFPLVKGASWVYTVYSSLLDSVIRTDTIGVDDVARRKGKSYYHLSTPWPPIGRAWLCAHPAGDLYWCDAPGKTEHPLLLFSAEPGAGWLLDGRHCMDSAIRVSCYEEDLDLTATDAQYSCFKSAWRPGDCYDAKWLGVIQKDFGPVYWILVGAGEAYLEWRFVEFLPAPSCDCKCHADPLCDGFLDALDLAMAIDVAFCGLPPPTDHGCWCYAHAMNGRTDVDCSGATDALDIGKIVDVLFGGADPAKEFCDPSQM